MSHFDGCAKTGYRHIVRDDLDIWECDDCGGVFRSKPRNAPIEEDRQEATR
jgi:ribosomal protein L37AE/L43A